MDEFITDSALLNTIEQHRSEDLIYPGELHNETGMSLKDIYMVLEKLVDSGFMESCLEIYCPSCGKRTGNIYKTIFEIPENVKCSNCDVKISMPLQYAIVIYKVL